MALKDLFPSLKFNADGTVGGDWNKLPGAADLLKDLERIMPLESYPLPPLPRMFGVPTEVPTPSLAGFGLKDIELKWIPSMFGGLSLQISSVPAKNAADGKDNNNGEDPLYLISSAPLPSTCNTPARILEWVRTQVILSISHEVDEWLKVDGHPVRDPHPAYRIPFADPQSGPELAADYLERRKREIAAEVKAAQPLKAEIAALSDSDPLPGILAEIKDKP